MLEPVIFFATTIFCFYWNQPQFCFNRHRLLLEPAIRSLLPSALSGSDTTVAIDAATAVGSTGEGRCRGRHREATMDATQRQEKKLLRSTAFLLRATTASIGGGSLRRGKRARFCEHGSSAAKDERGAGLFPPSFFSSAFSFAAAFSESLTKESYGLEKLDRVAHVGPAEIFGRRAGAY